MASKEQLQEALNQLWERYGNTLAMLDDAITQLEEKPKETIREVVVPLSQKQEKIYRQKIKALEKEIEELKNQPPVEVEKIITKEIPVEIEKIVEVIKQVEVPKETVVTREVEVPGPERIVEVPGPERIVEVEVPGPERIVEKEVIKEKVVEGPRRTQTVELPATGDLRTAATLIANSEMNVNDLTTEEILTMLKDLSAEEVNNKLGFWAIPLPSSDDDNDGNDTRYTIKK